MSETIYESDFVKYLPQPLTHDPKMVVLARAAARELLEVSGLAKTVLIYPRIDELPEELLDILAYDLHVDWYDYSYPIETKRNVLKSSVGIHKKIGTKRAVEKALSDVYKMATVEEWFEYGGEPYHFKVRVDIGNTGLAAETTKQIEEKMWFYKNLRSHCDGIFYAISTGRAEVKTAGFHKIGAKLKVKPFLPAGIEAGSGKAVEAYLREKISLKVKPVLPGGIAGKAGQSERSSN